MKKVKVVELKLIRHRNNNTLTFLITYEDGSVKNLQYIKRISTHYCYCVLIDPLLENHYIFKILGILDANAYVSNIVGYETAGNWPEVHTKEDLEKVLNYLECYLEM